MTDHPPVEAHHDEPDEWRSVGEVAAAIQGELNRRRLRRAGEEAAGSIEEKAGALEAARRS